MNQTMYVKCKPVVFISVKKINYRLSKLELYYFIEGAGGES